MIVCNVFDIEELEKLEAEEAVRVERISRSLVGGPSIAMYKLTDTGDRYHSNL